MPPPLKKRKGSNPMPTIMPYPQLVPYYVSIGQPTTSHSQPTLIYPSTADQREQARKSSHSAIERRRRERINDKILQLKKLIPSCADRDNLHKMTILQSAIEYIDYLQNIIKQHDSFIPKESFSVTTDSIKSKDKDRNMNIEHILC